MGSLRVLQGLSLLLKYSHIWANSLAVYSSSIHVKKKEIFAVVGVLTSFASAKAPLKTNTPHASNYTSPAPFTETKSHGESFTPGSSHLWGKANKQTNKRVRHVSKRQVHRSLYWRLAGTDAELCSLHEQFSQLLFGVFSEQRHSTGFSQTKHLIHQSLKSQSSVKQSFCLVVTLCLA